MDAGSPQSPPTPHETAACTTCRDARRRGPPLSPSTRRRRPVPRTGSTWPPAEEPAHLSRDSRCTWAGPQKIALRTGVRLGSVADDVRGVRSVRRVGPNVPSPSATACGPTAFPVRRNPRARGSPRLGRTRRRRGHPTGSLHVDGLDRDDVGEGVQVGGIRRARRNGRCPRRGRGSEHPSGVDDAVPR